MKGLPIVLACLSLLTGCPLPLEAPVTPGEAGPPSSEKALRSFSFLIPPAGGEIDQETRSVTVSVPHGTDVTSLIAVFETTGAQVSVDDTEQTSGVTINDFTEPLTYLVTAEDGTSASYRVSAAALPGSEKALTAFTIQGMAAAVSIDAQARIIRVRVPLGTDLGALTAVFTTTGAAVLVDGREQFSGLTVNDFTRPVDYQVRAEDGSAECWSVRVAAAIGLLINELDVDQVGTDNAELIELYATAEVDCGGLVIALVNGGEVPGKEYARIDLSSAGTLAAGSFLVVAGSRVSVAPTARKLTPAGWESTNRIQNGPCDAVMLFDTIGKRVIDTVCYGGVLHRASLTGETGEVDATEGSPGPRPTATRSRAPSAETPAALTRVRTGPISRSVPFQRREHRTTERRQTRARRPSQVTSRSSSGIAEISFTSSSKRKSMSMTAYIRPAASRIGMAAVMMSLPVYLEKNRSEKCGFCVCSTATNQSCLRKSLLMRLRNSPFSPRWVCAWEMRLPSRLVTARSWIDASRVTTSRRKLSILAGSRERTSSDADILSAMRRAFSMAAPCAFWKSEMNREGRKCLACATSSSGEMLVVRPCAYCSATHVVM